MKRGGMSALRELDINRTPAGLEGRSAPACAAIGARILAPVAGVILFSLAASGSVYAQISPGQQQPAPVTGSAGTGQSRTGEPSGSTTAPGATTGQGGLLGRPAQNFPPGAARTTAAPPVLGLEQAINISIENNVTTLLAREGINEAQGRAEQLLAGLLPNLSSTVFQENRTTNLRAQGFSFSGGPISFPSFIGPFNTFDARIYLVQTVISLSAIRDYRSGRAGIRLAGLQVPLAREQVATAVTIAYLDVLRTDQVIEATRADLTLAEALLKLAQDQHDAGVATGIDVVRAQTGVAQQRVRVLQAQTNSDQSRLALQRVVGLPLGSTLTLADSMRFTVEPLPLLESAVQTARENRYEIRIAEENFRLRELERRARVADQYPSVEAFGDYGDSGSTIFQNNRPTRTYGLRLNVPVFNGGLTRGRIAVAASQARQAEIQLNDTRGQVEEDVRLAIVTLRTATAQVSAAEETLLLAERELQLARDRFQAGVADNIEVVNAQAALQDARSNNVNALATYNSARVNLAAALGRAEAFRF